MGWVLWTIVGAAAIHVAEEYLGDWVGSVQEVVPGATLAQFVVVNAAFLALSDVASAILFYVPLAVLAYYLAARSQQLTLSSGVGVALLGGLWMALPIGFQLVRLALGRRKG